LVKTLVQTEKEALDIDCLALDHILSSLALSRNSYPDHVIRIGIAVGVIELMLVESAARIRSASL
jgi:hypothetical protein